MCARVQKLGIPAMNFKKYTVYRRRCKNVVEEKEVDIKNRKQSLKSDHGMKQ